MSDLNSSTTEKKILIEADNVDKSYSTQREVIHVLTQMSVQVCSGEVLGIVGASGGGKSTLLHVLGGLDKPLTGNVLFQGKDIYKQPNGYLENFRNAHIGFVFQFFNLLPDFSALENTMFPALIRNQERHLAKERAEYLLSAVGMQDRMHHKPGELSGVPIARTDGVTLYAPIDQIALLSGLSLNYYGDLSGGGFLISTPQGAEGCACGAGFRSLNNHYETRKIKNFLRQELVN